MITLFTILKPFTGISEIIQKNAIRSWTKLNPSCEIILFGNEKGTAEIAKELNLIHIPLIKVNEYNTPIISEVFQKAQDLSNNKILCYLNADIILLDDFSQAIKKINGLTCFLMVGQRWNININEPILFQRGWDAKIRTTVKEQGSIHPPSGMDYFVFPIGEVSDMPPFIVGRPAWDNWMIGNALKKGVRVIDATDSILAIHQNHNYAHVIGSSGKNWLGPEAIQNYNLINREYLLKNILDADYVLSEDKITKSSFFRHFTRRQMKNYVWHQIKKLKRIMPQKKFY